MNMKSFFVWQLLSIYGNGMICMTGQPEGNDLGSSDFILAIAYVLPITEFLNSKKLCCGLFYTRTNSTTKYEISTYGHI